MMKRCIDRYIHAPGRNDRADGQRPRLHSKLAYTAHLRRQAGRQAAPGPEMLGGTQAEEKPSPTNSRQDERGRGESGQEGRVSLMHHISGLHYRPGGFVQRTTYVAGHLDSTTPRTQYGTETYPCATACVHAGRSSAASGDPYNRWAALEESSKRTHTRRDQRR